MENNHHTALKADTGGDEPNISTPDESRNNNPEKSKKNHKCKPIFIIIGVVILLVAGAAVAYFAFSSTPAVAKIEYPLTAFVSNDNDSAWIIKMNGEAIK